MGRTRRGYGGDAMKWIRESMTQIDLVDGEKKLAYIAYKNFRWLLYEGGEEWGIDLKIYEQHQVEVAQMAAVEELIRYHAEKAKLFRKARKEMAA